MKKRINEIVVYGPVESRRLGKSLGINLSILKPKKCPFDCVYCYAGRTEKKEKVTFKELPLQYVKKQIKEGIKEKLQKKVHFDYVTLAGNGEPTNYEGFLKIAHYLKEVLKELKVQKPTAIFTNSSTINDKKIREVINQLDRKFFKLDAYDEDSFQRINNPAKGISFKKVVEGLSQINNLELSTAVLKTGKAEIDNYSGLKSKKFINILKKIKPARIYLYDIDLYTAEGYFKRVSLEDMKILKEYISKNTGIETIILRTPQSRGVHPLYEARARLNCQEVKSGHSK